MARSNLHAALIDDVLAGLRVFNTLDGLNIPEELLEIRAVNIVAGLVGNYELRPLSTDTGPGPWIVGLIREAERQATVPVGRSWSCQCEPCHTYKFNQRGS